MLDEPHDLQSELPEWRVQILALAEKDPEFRDLLERYDELDARIQDLEMSGTPVDDPVAVDLKKHRLALKDLLFSRLSTQTEAV